MPAKTKTPEAEIVPVAEPPTELARRTAITAEDLMPVLDLAQAVRRRNFMTEIAKTLMVADVDYGAIPGTGSKPTLLKAGAERLCTLFGLSPELIEETAIEDWGEAGEPLFYYRFKVRLTKNGILLAEGIGSANSREAKYRYRMTDRKCPHCGNASIIRGREEYGGGWLCFHKRGGCGAKFDAGDPAIEDQTVGRILNPDIADQVNTIQKIAHKRALVAAVLIATNASEFFTQDVEDMELIDLPGEAPPRNATPPPRPKESAPPPPAEPPAQPWSNYNAMINAFAALHGRLAQVAPDTHDAIYRNVLASFEVKHSNEFRNYKTASACYKTLLAKVEQLEKEQREKQQQQQPQAAPAAPKPEAEEDF